MAAKTKTVYTEVKIDDFLESFVATEQKRQDSKRLVTLMKKWSGFEPKMWGPSIIGFGNYHYKYASGHEGDAPILGFSPRKAAFSLYVYTPTEENDRLLQSLGKFTMGKSCIYFKKLADLNLETLEKMCLSTITFHEEGGGNISHC